MKFCPAARFVDVYLNGSYRGTYQISDQVQVHKRRIDIDEDKALNIGLVTVYATSPEMMEAAIREINKHRGTPNHIIACGTQTREKPVPSYTRKEIEEYNGME